MTKEELKVGQVVYMAVIFDTMQGDDVLRVREYEVKMLGKSRFELVSKSARIRGFYDHYRDTFRALKSSPEGAVAFLEARLGKDGQELQKKFERDMDRNREHLKLVTDWKRQRSA